MLITISHDVKGKFHADPALLRGMPMRENDERTRQEEKGQKGNAVHENFPGGVRNKGRRGKAETR